MHKLYEDDSESDIDVYDLIKYNLEKGDHTWADEYASKCFSSHRDEEAIHWYVIAGDYGAPDTVNWLYHCDHRIEESAKYTLEERKQFLRDYFMETNNKDEEKENKIKLY